MDRELLKMDLFMEITSAKTNGLTAINHCLFFTSSDFFSVFSLFFNPKLNICDKKESLEVSEDSANKAENLPKSPAMKMLP